MDARHADWLSIVLQGLLGALLGSLAGRLFVMNRITKFMARDQESSMIMVAGCIVAGVGLFMRLGDGLHADLRWLGRHPRRVVQHRRPGRLRKPDRHHQGVQGEDLVRPYG